MLDADPAIVARESAVLVVVDVQDRLADVVERRDAVVSAIVKLVAVAAVLGVPIIATRQYPEGLGDCVAELLDALDAARGAGADVRTVDKIAFDCTAEPAFAAALEELGAQHIVVTGMETHICVGQTALALAVGRCTPHVVADATCSRRADDHEVALARLRASHVDVTCSEAVIYEMLGRAATDEFRAVLAIVKGA